MFGAPQACTQPEADQVVPCFSFAQLLTACTCTLLLTHIIMKTVLCILVMIVILQSCLEMVSGGVSPSVYVPIGAIVSGSA